MKDKDLIEGRLFEYMPSTKKTNKKPMFYEFVGFNKVGNCIFKSPGGLQESQFILTLYYIKSNFKVKEQ